MGSFECVERLLTVSEVADRLALSRASVYRKVHAGEIPAVRLGGDGNSLRVPERELREWLYSTPVVAPVAGDAA